jgi:hypothetical protein
MCDTRHPEQSEESGMMIAAGMILDASVCSE